MKNLWLFSCLFFGVYAFFQPAVNGIVVRGFDFTVDLAAVWCKLVGTQDIVDAHKEATVMVADARAVGSGDVTVGQAVGNGAVGV